MDCKNWCSSFKSSTTTPVTATTSSTPTRFLSTPTFPPTTPTRFLSTPTLPSTTPTQATSKDISAFSDLLKEVDERFRFDVDVANDASKVRTPTNNVRVSLDRFGNVREDLILMKNELNALKKDLSSAKKGLECDKKPLMVRPFKVFQFNEFFLFPF